MCLSCNDKNHDDLGGFWADLEDGVSPSSNSVDRTGLEQRQAATPAEFAESALSNSTFDPNRPATFEEPCKKCWGSGYFTGYTGRILGQCFTCKGTGKQVFKTSAETRQKAAAAKKARHEAKVLAWLDAHPAETEWMKAAAGRGFNFATDMLAAIAKYGDLKDYKLAKVREFMAKDAEREQAQAAIAANAPTVAAASLDKIEEAFGNAIANQIKFPKMRLDTFLFSKVMSGKNAGAIYIKSIDRDANGERRYMGKIVDGRFLRAYSTTAEEEQRIVAAASDPKAAALAYGRRVGACSICGRELTNAESIERAIGPICADRYGW